MSIGVPASPQERAKLKQLRFEQWLSKQRGELKDGEASKVLDELGRLRTLMQEANADEAVDTIQKSLNYLSERRGKLAYATFQAQGYPIGSGSVESANKRARAESDERARHATRNPAMSIPCWRCAIWSAMIAGQRAGTRSDKPGSRRCTPSDGCGRVHRLSRQMRSSLRNLCRLRRRSRLGCPQQPSGIARQCPQPASRPILLHQRFRAGAGIRLLLRRIRGDAPFFGAVLPN